MHGYCSPLVSSDGRTAMVLVFFVLLVRPIYMHFSSNDCNMSFKSSHEVTTRVMSPAYSRPDNCVSQLNPLLPTTFASGWYVLYHYSSTLIPVLPSAMRMTASKYKLNNVGARTPAFTKLELNMRLNMVEDGSTDGLACLGC